MRRGAWVLGVGGQLGDPAPVAPEGPAELQALRHLASARIEDQISLGSRLRSPTPGERTMYSSLTEMLPDSLTNSFNPFT